MVWEIQKTVKVTSAKKRLVKYLNEDQDLDGHHQTNIAKILTQLKCMRYREMQNFSKGKKKMQHFENVSGCAIFSV